MSRWSDIQRDSVVWKHGCTQWVGDLVLKGWKLYYVNFMFEPLRGAQAAIIPKMRRGIHKFYGRFCLEFVHNGRAKSEQQRMPQLWLFPDLPVNKHQKSSLREVTINGGLHYNGPMLIPPVSRFNECPINHIRSNQSGYARYGIQRIDVQPGGDIPGLADYAIKSIANGKADEYDIIILPRPVRELPTKRKLIVDPKERLMKDIQSSSNVSNEIACHLRDKIINRTSL